MLREMRGAASEGAALLLFGAIELSEERREKHSAGQEIYGAIDGLKIMLYTIDVYSMEGGIKVIRTQIYLTAEQKAALESLSKMKSAPMADLIREAVSEYLTRQTVEHRIEILDNTFGAVSEWGNVDSVEYARTLRSQWAEREKRLRKGDIGHERG